VRSIQSEAQYFPPAQGDDVLPLTVGDERVGVAMEGQTVDFDGHLHFRKADVDFVAADRAIRVPTRNTLLSKEFHK
jgi:hypothetical protein